MTANLCVVCEKRPTPDGFGCSGCAGKATGRLTLIVELAPDARLVAAGLVRRGSGRGSGKPESLSPLNDGVTDALGEIQNVLTTLARDIAETRGRTLPDAHGRDPIVVAAQWLFGQVEWLRHAAEGTQPWAPGAYGEIGDCASKLRGIVDGRSEQRFLGLCGSTRREVPAEDGCPVNCACHNGPHYACDEPGGCGSAGCGRTIVVETEPCKGDVYAREGVQHGACRTCGATVGVEDRRARLDAEVRSHAFRASEIAKAYDINVNTIRSWAARGQLVPHGHDADERPLYNVGEVLDLAAADAARRATEQAKRARRRERTALDDDGRLSA